VDSGVLRFTPARTYLSAAAVALGLTVFSAWWATRWLPAAVPALLLGASAGLVLFLGLRPAVEVTDLHIRAGRWTALWSEVRRVDQTGWVSPLVLDLTLQSGERMRLIYPGETAASNQLLREIQQRSTGALINGVPWRQLFGQPREEQAKPLPAPRYHLLTEEDEAEVERLYHKLRSAGRLDPEK
jgi:hypothetical protein